MFYLANGLTLHSDHALSGFEAISSAKPNVELHFSVFPDRLFSRIVADSAPPYYVDPSLTAWRSDPYYALRYEDGTEFLIDGHVSEIWARWGTKSSFDSAVAYFTGPVFGLFLRIRGVLCLHASAIEDHGAAFAIAGPCGAGKSTLAASFARAGHRVFSDDVVALRHTATAFEVQPSWSRFKLWPDSVEALYGPEVDFPRLDAAFEKRVVPAQSVQDNANLPLRVVYLLKDRSPQVQQTRIEPLDAMNAMVSLASHTYCNYLLTPEMRRHEFQQLRELIGAIMVREITIPADFAQLPSVREALLADFAQQSRNPVSSC